MRALGLQGVSRRRGVHATRRNPDAQPAPNLVDRDFAAPSPNRLWIADIIYAATWTGFLYFAVVMDAWSRKIVGWAIRTNLRTELVLGALEMPLWQQRP